jgi:hypothetical protein
MTEPIQFHQRVGADGVLSLQIPLGISEADSEVLITIQPLSASATESISEDEDWHAFIESTYGSCADLGLERHDQGVFEEREPLA